VHAGMRFGRMCRPLELDVLDDDVLSSIFAIFIERDFASLVSLRYVCRRLLSIADAVLANKEHTVHLVSALVGGRLPGSCIAAVERRAARAAFANELPKTAILQITDYANLFVSGRLYPAQSWGLECQLQGDDCYRLVGFDSVPLHLSMCGQSVLPSPSQPLKMWMPCALVQPFSQATRTRIVRRVPMELCRTVKRPTSDELPPRGTPTAHIVDNGHSWDPFLSLGPDLQPRGMALIDTLLCLFSGTLSGDCAPPAAPAASQPAACDPS